MEKKKQLTDMLGRSTKKLSPASVRAQKVWQNFPSKLKSELRKVLPDDDGDGVPTGFDCQPRNKKKQESFLPVDDRYSKSNSVIIPDKSIGEGNHGEVFTVKGNRHMVVKVPLGYRKHTNSKYSRESDRVFLINHTEESIEKEYRLYVFYKLESLDLFAPTKLVELPLNDLGISTIGLLRPRLKPLDKGHTITSKQLEELRKKLIKISHYGICPVDGLQLGIDKVGRVLIFDFGAVEKRGVDQAFYDNNILWRALLERNARRRNETYTDVRELQRKYGWINPDERY